ncbi:hypothetical protein BGW37DRAFT_473877 [Umbelopsis sp. PMI_123]|nr:hypothetical protein BGW37DRAFT_473877 [Umbelopsis sp. PMI_123]
MSFRNPSPPLGYECESTSRPKATIAPIILKLVENVVGGNMDGQHPESIEDTPLERTLCTAWDLAGIDEYAAAILENNIQVVILKICTTTKRPRTRELAVGTLANIASHHETGTILLEQEDIFLLISSILWNENDARVLHEASRLLEAFLKLTINMSEQSVIDSPCLTQFLATAADRPSVISRYMVIIMNTLNTDLLVRSLQVIRHIITYMHATNLLYTSPAIKSDAFKLVSWATERLEEEGRGIGIGGFNKSVAKNLMHVVWAIGAYKIVESSEYDPDLSASLAESMKRIQSYIDEEYDISQEDAAIQDLAQLLTESLYIE